MNEMNFVNLFVRVIVVLLVYVDFKLCFSKKIGDIWDCLVCLVISLFKKFLVNVSKVICFINIWKK